MAQPMVSRTQRRTEKRLVTWILVLVAGVAVASFSLGFVIGQQSVSAPVISTELESDQSAVASKSVPLPPQKTPEPATAETQKLTFYDNLPKGDQAPLGSGINLPPQSSAATTVKPAPKQVKAKPQPVQSTPKPLASAAADPAGAYIVQVASFRAEDDARKLVTRLQNRTLSAMIERADLGDKGVWYRVLCGPYGNRSDADLAAAELQKEERLSALVKRR